MPLRGVGFVAFPTEGRFDSALPRQPADPLAGCHHKNMGSRCFRKHARKHSVSGAPRSESEISMIAGGNHSLIHSGFESRAALHIPPYLWRIGVMAAYQLPKLRVRVRSPYAPPTADAVQFHTPLLIDGGPERREVAGRGDPPEAAQTIPQSAALTATFAQGSLAGCQ